MQAGKEADPNAANAAAKARGPGRRSRRSARNLPLFSKLLLGLALLLLPLLTLQAVRMGHQVVQRLEGLSTAATDSMQWMLSQVEVDHLKLELATASTKSPQDLPQLRRQFDIYYSRIVTLQESPLFVELRKNGSGQEMLQKLLDRLDRFAVLIDVGDTELIENRDQILAQLLANGEDARELALFGVVMQVEDAESRRLQLFSILWRLAVVVLSLVVALAITALLLGWMYRRGRILSEERSKSTANMEAMISSSLDAILVVDQQGRIQAFNGAAEAIFGYQRAEAIGVTMGELIIPPHLRQAHRAGMARFLKTGVPRVAGQGRVQLEAQRKTGEVFPIEVSISVSRSQADLMFVGFIRDISDRIAAEEELRSARDDALAGERAKADLLTVMSHEMRTPLTGVLGAIDLMRNTGPSAEQERYLNAMQVSGELLLHHVNGVLQLSSLEAGMSPESLRPFDLRELISGLVESQQASARSRGNALTLNYHVSQTDMVAGRPRALQQALLNLIGNAIKFTRNGAVLVDVQHGTNPDQIEFHVSDTGQGIDGSDLKRIFEDFITLDASFGRDSEGTGLGLAITRRMVEAMGGTITCESELGEGSLFTLILPLPRAQNLPRAGVQAPPKSVKSSELLVVEDNDINRELLQQMLQQIGHQVTVAPGGAEAVAACGEHQFDLVLMDISMPEVDGIEALRRIRAAKLAEGIEIVALTAHTAPEDHARILKAGFAEVVTKPISREELIVLVTRHTAAAETRKEEAGTSDIDQFFEALGGARARGFLAGFCTEFEAFLSDVAAASQLQAPHRKEAHRLAGSAAVLGMVALRSALIEVEMHAGDTVPDLGVLSANWHDCRQQVMQYLAQPNDG